MNFEKIDFCKINSKNQIRIPDSVKDELGVGKGDGLDFKKNPENGNVVVDKLDR